MARFAAIRTRDAAQNVDHQLIITCIVIFINIFQTHSYDDNNNIMLNHSNTSREHVDFR